VANSLGEKVYTASNHIFSWKFSMYNVAMLQRFQFRIYHFLTLNVVTIQVESILQQLNLVMKTATDLFVV